MNRRGVCYDVGRTLMGRDWRPAFDRDEARRELEIIRDDLHCNAVRICGQDLDRLAAVAEDALERGLEVWLSPELWDHGPDQTLAYLAEAAGRAEDLRRHRPDRLVLSVGSELTLFMRGILAGESLFDRLTGPSFAESVRSGAHNGPLNEFLSRANDVVRGVFNGRVTYASVPLESVDWRPFDVVGLDLYREARIRDRFTDLVRRYFAYGLPVVITETGCCTYRGAAAAGGRGWAIVDHDATGGFGGTVPELNGDYVRDESEQAGEVADLLGIFAAAGVDGTFVMTFVAPLSVYSDDPRHDLDMPSYSLVKSYANRLGDLAHLFPGEFWDAGRSGTAYPDMPWEPKESFRAVAEFYAEDARRTRMASAATR